MVLSGILTVIGLRQPCTQSHYRTWRYCRLKQQQHCTGPAALAAMENRSVRNDVFMLGSNDYLIERDL